MPVALPTSPPCLIPQLTLHKSSNVNEKENKASKLRRKSTCCLHAHHTHGYRYLPTFSRTHYTRTGRLACTAGSAAAAAALPPGHFLPHTHTHTTQTQEQELEGRGLGLPPGLCLPSPPLLSSDPPLTCHHHLTPSPSLPLPRDMHVPDGSASACSSPLSIYLSFLPHKPARSSCLPGVEISTSLISCISFCLYLGEAKPSPFFLSFFLSSLPAHTGDGDGGAGCLACNLPLPMPAVHTCHFKLLEAGGAFLFGNFSAFPCTTPAPAHTTTAHACRRAARGRLPHTLPLLCLSLSFALSFVTCPSRETH